MKELFIEQDLLKKISGSASVDYQSKAELTSLLQQLQEISFQVNKFQHSDSA